MSPDVLGLAHMLIDGGEFRDRSYEDLGPNRELRLLDGPATAFLELLVNRSELFALVQAITDCDRIGSFGGRVYRFVPDSGHHIAWHNDLEEHRLLAMSVNLSREVYSGGVLQIRNRESKQIIHEVANVGFGDAVIFRIAPKLQHRNTEIDGTAVKTAFAGWFKSRPEFLSTFKPQSSQNPI